MDVYNVHGASIQSKNIIILPNLMKLGWAQPLSNWIHP